jgi:hypothetical protein
VTAGQGEPVDVSAAVGAARTSVIGESVPVDVVDGSAAALEVVALLDVADASGAADEVGDGAGVALVLPVEAPGLGVAAPALGAGAGAVEGARPPVDPPVPVPVPPPVPPLVPPVAVVGGGAAGAGAVARTELAENVGPPLVPPEPVAP